MLRSYRLGSTESNNATPLKWGKTNELTVEALVSRRLTVALDGLALAI